MAFRRRLFVGLIGLMMVASVAAQAASGDFCRGFEAGWKAAFENHNKLVQLTPLCPLPPLNGDTFSVGYEIGLRKALAKIGG